MCYLKHLLVALLLIFLGGCSGTAPKDLKPWETNPGAAPNAPGSSSKSTTRPDYGPKLAVGKPYKVKRGDTLYAIAFRLGLDFRDLAARNGIQAPYTISVGQVLTTSQLPVAASSKASERSAAERRGSSKATTSKPKRPVPATKAASKTVSKATSTQTKVAKKSQTSRRASATQAVATSRPVSRWQWPATGKVVRTFAANVHKGIDIAGGRGDPITATAGGKVVYAGAGVTGYGSLIIVKHNETYLSAYGHNERLLVSEGNVVKVGQQIATMGSSGTNSVKLHFELRRLGKPVDPLTLLPKR